MASQLSAIESTIPNSVMTGDHCTNTQHIFNLQSQHGTCCGSFTAHHACLCQEFNSLVSKLNALCDVQDARIKMTTAFSRPLNGPHLYSMFSVSEHHTT
jgi:hypothetical protein